MPPLLVGDRRLQRPEEPGARELADWAALTLPEQKQRDVQRPGALTYRLVEAKGVDPVLEAVSASFQMFSRR